MMAPRVSSLLDGIHYKRYLGVDLAVLACLGARNQSAFRHISIQLVLFGFGKGTRGGKARLARQTGA